jgi:CRP-like cAMP-binding protein
MARYEDLMDSALVEKIVDGSITVDDLETYQKLIRENSENFDLIVSYADFLCKQDHLDLALSSYETALNGYVLSGNLLKSVMMALRQWRLRMPDKTAINLFMEKLERGNFTDSSFKALLDGLSKHEKLEIILKLKREHFPCKGVIKKLGDPEEKLFFVASGILKENCYEAMGSKSRRYMPPVRNMREDDCFGKVYPLNDTIKSESIVEALSRAELAVLCKEDLRRLSLKYPSIEKAVIKICRVRLRQDLPSGVLIRRHYRYPLNVVMSLRILAGGAQLNGKCFSGCSKNVSMGGVGFLADDIARDTKDALSSLLEKNQKIRVAITFQNVKISVMTAGAIVRLQESIESGVKTVVLGIEFDEMTPNLQGLLFYVAKTFATYPETGSSLPPQ